MTYLCICARLYRACWLLNHSKEKSRLCSLTYADMSQACCERKPETEKPDEALDNQLQEEGGRQKSKPLTSGQASSQQARLLVPEEHWRGPPLLAAAAAALRLARQLDWQAQQRVGCQQPRRW